MVGAEDLVAASRKVDWPNPILARWGRMNRRILLIAPLLLAACDRGGAVKDDIKPAPPLNEMVETPGDWSGLGPAIGQTPSQSAVLTKGPLPTDLDAMLGEHAIDFRKRMESAAGPLHHEGSVLVSMTPPGLEAAYLVVDAADHAMEAGRRTVDGWQVERTPGAKFTLPPNVAALKAAP